MFPPARLSGCARPLLRAVAGSTAPPSPSARATSACAAAQTPDSPHTASPGTTRVGWIGTGVMGVSMAKHIIAAGYDLTVYTRTMSKAEPLMELGASRADTPFEVAQQSDVVVSMVGYPKDVRQVSAALPSLSPLLLPPALSSRKRVLLSFIAQTRSFSRTPARTPTICLLHHILPSNRLLHAMSPTVSPNLLRPHQVLLGDDPSGTPFGVLPGLSPGGILVDMTTSEPSLARTIAAEALSRGCYSIDAPVSGGDVGAKNGTLSIMAGGDEGAIEAVRPLLGCMGKVRRLGGPGAGQSCKMANQV